MVKRFVFAVPGDLATPTGGFVYDRRMIAELGHLGWHIDHLDLGEGFPWPNEDTRVAAHKRLLAIPPGLIIVVDGLALGVLPESASNLAGRNPLLASSAACFPLIRIGVLRAIMIIRRQEWKGLPGMIRRRVAHEGQHSP